MANNPVKQIELKLKDTLKDVFKDLGDASLGHGTTTKQGRELATNKGAEIINKSGNVKPDHIPVIVRRGDDGLVEYVAGDKETTEKIGKAMGGTNYEPAFDYFDKKLSANKDKEFTELVDLSGHNLRPNGLTGSDVSLLVDEVPKDKRSWIPSAMDSAKLENLALSDKGLFSKEGGQNLLASFLGHGYAGKARDYLQGVTQSLKDGDSTLKKAGIPFTWGADKALGLATSPTLTLSTALGGGAIYAAGKSQGKSAAEESKENASGAKINAQTKRLLEKFGGETDWSAEDSYEKHRTSDVYDRFTMLRAWNKVREATDSTSGRVGRLMEQDPEVVFQSLMKAYQAELDANKGVVHKRDAAGNPIRKPNGEYETVSSPKTAKQIEEYARKNGLTLAGYSTQTNKDDPKKPHVGFLAKGPSGKRFNAILTIKSKDELDAEDAEELAVKQTSAKPEVEPNPKNIRESAALLKSKMKSPVGWTYIDTSLKGIEALTTENGQPLPRQIFE